MRRPLSWPVCWGIAAIAASWGAGSAHAADVAAPAIRRVLAGQLDVTRRLLTAVDGERPGENVLVSPAGAVGLLAAVDLGAGPAMHGAIVKVLGIAPGPAAEADLVTLREAAVRFGPDDDLSTATRVIFDRTLHPLPDGLDRLKTAGVEGVVMDLHAPSAVADIDTWAAHATREKIDSIVDETDPSDRMIALDALFFSGR